MDVMTLAAKLTLNTSEFDSGLNQSEKSMEGLSSGGVAWGNLISRAVEKAGQAMMNFGKKTVQVGMDFDAQMSQVKALGQLQDEDFQKVRKRAMELGESTKFTAAQVGEAFSYMALAGWDTQEMLDGIDGVLNLAAASGEDLGRVSDIVTDAITAMGLTAKDSGHFVDVLAAASANSNTTVAQMGEAFKYLATTGGVLQYSIDDVAVTLGLLANNGIKAGQAGTSMRRILNTLINPTDKAAAAMEDLGISLFDTTTNARKPLAQVLQEFRQVFKDAGLQLEEGFNEEEIQGRLDKLNEWYDEESAKIDKMSSGKKKAMKELDKQYSKRFTEEVTPNQAFLGKLGDIGGLRGISSLFAIMNSTDEDFQQIVDSVANSEGSAQEMAETMLDNLMGDVTIFKSALEGLQIVVSDEFKQPLREFVQLLTEEVGKLNEAFKSNGVLGMFLEVADWIITGVADSLKEPDTTQVEKFGAAIGEFIGKVAAKLITDLPAMVGGIVELGVSLATGLLEGLQKGLFGDKSQVQTFIDGMNAELEGIEVNSVKAQGLLAYLQELAEAGDENVTKTDAWKTAVEQLEEVMPGAKEILEAEGATIDENIEKLRALTSEYRNKAIQQAMVNTLQKEYEQLAEQGVEREKEIVKAGAARNTQNAIVSTFRGGIQKYAQNILGGITSGEYEDFGGEMKPMVENLLAGYAQIGDELVSLDNLSADQLANTLKSLTDYLEQGPGGENIWETDQGYLSPEEIERLNKEYDTATGEISAANDKIKGINEEMDKTKSAISTTEKAVESVTAELNADASSVAEAGSNLASAINGAADKINGGEEHSHAIGSAYIPYDNYPALLHRGERVVTATENRRGTGNVDIAGLEEAIASAIRESMKDVTVRSYLNGRDITDEVNRNNIRGVKARRYNE